MNALLALALLVQAAESPDRTIRAHLKAQAEAVEKDFLPGVATAADFERLRPLLREQYFDMLGLKPLPEKTPLHPTLTGKLEFPGFTVEKIHFQSRPGLYVTANVYAPVPNEGRHPAILYSIGHYNAKRDGHKAAVQDHGIWFATHGYVAILVDTIELGEVTCTHHGTYNQKRWWWHSAGFTPAAVECWNAIRAIDYLQSRPDVDPDRIGATGISGGGAATFWISAADERVKASAPVSGMSDLTWYIGEDGVDGHCDCMFLYNAYGWPWTQIAALVAPRPMLFTNSDHDTIFPMPANERIINRLERLYSKFGASDKVDAMVSVGGHAMRTDLRRAVFEFFNRTLKNDPRPVTDADAGLGPDGKASRIPGRDLRVFPEDRDIPADQINTTIDEVYATLITKARADLPKEGGFEAWRTALVDRLKTLCFAGGAPVRPVLSDAAFTGPALPLPAELPLIVLEAGEAAEPRVAPDWSRPFVGERTSLLFRPRSGWTTKNPPNTIERAHALLGGSVDAYRVREIGGVLEGKKASVEVVGRGQAGILGAYAALLDPRITQVTVVDPPASHRDGPHFIGVLRVCDIPEALGALAPRKLTLVGAKDPAFDRTVELYRLAGAADRIERR